MKRKGFTLVELLVVIAIIALLMSILMPALSRVRRISQRVVCGANLAGIGKTILAYSNDYGGAFPVAGGRNAKWTTSGKIHVWDATIAKPGYTLSQTAYNAKDGACVTITSSLFLLIKYSGASAKQFVCKGDQGATVFNNLGIVTPLEDITEAWDFGGPEIENVYKGGTPGTHVSYSYHMPYTIMEAGIPRMAHPIHSLSSPQSPLMADRNPYCDKNNYDNSTPPQLIDVALPGWDPVSNLFIDEDGLQNSYAHQREGQEVLYQDGHVKFEEHPNVGIDNDNIWHYWTGDNSADTGHPAAIRDEKTKARETGIIYSTRPVYSTAAESPNGGGVAIPWSEKDSFLVNDYQEVGNQVGSCGR
ncbi:MAG: type II secretion system protein [Planctomycetota bacterium]|jgi:prepilin-type N-terminal cleavage/methylation domain-containing protein